LCVDCNLLFSSSGQLCFAGHFVDANFCTSIHYLCIISTRGCTHLDTITDCDCAHTTVVDR
jgi:hypothetical protein